MALAPGEEIVIPFGNFTSRHAIIVATGRVTFTTHCNVCHWESNVNIPAPNDDGRSAADTALNNFASAAKTHHDEMKCTPDVEDEE